MNYKVSLKISILPSRCSFAYSSDYRPSHTPYPYLLLCPSLPFCLHLTTFGRIKLPHRPMLHIKLYNPTQNFARPKSIFCNTLLLRHFGESAIDNVAAAHFEIVRIKQLAEPVEQGVLTFAHMGTKGKSKRMFIEYQFFPTCRGLPIIRLECSARMA